MYQILLSRKTEKFLTKTSKSDRNLFKQFIKALDIIAENPKAGKSLVANLKGFWSYRVRDYRILYEIKHEEIMVYVEKIAHRKESYQDL